MSLDGDGVSTDSEEEVEQFDDAASLVDDPDEGDDEGAEVIEVAEGDLEDDSDGEDESDSSMEDEDEDEDLTSPEGAEDQDEDEEQVDINSVPRDGAADSVSLVVKKDQEVPSPRRAESPTQRRKSAFHPQVRYPRSYAVDVVCALPHPVATHALASSICLTHLLTGSDDGYIRDYDVFAACNGKNFLTAPQRQHCGFVEGVIKAGVLRSWWDSSALSPVNTSAEPTRPPIYSLLVQSDALWGLSGLKDGSVNLFTIRHEPGRIIHSLANHRGPVAGLAMSPDEKSFFSAGWDGEVLLWDLNTGGIARRFPIQGAQLSAIALRPLYLPTLAPLVSFGNSLAPSVALPVTEVKEAELRSLTTAETSTLPMVKDEVSPAHTSTKQDEHHSPQHDDNSEASYDPLFDDETDNYGTVESFVKESNIDEGLAFPGSAPLQQKASANTPAATYGSNEGSIPHVKSNMPFTFSTPLFDRSLATRFSYDVFLTASINGQILLWDKRTPSGENGVGRLQMGDKCPPWCVSACWSADGRLIYAGRRNGTIDMWDIRHLGTHAGGPPRLLRTLRNPTSSGEVSCVASFPDAKHLVCFSASQDNIRLWNVSETDDVRSRGAQFKIITGHHGGQVSQILVDPSCRFMISASGNRGWFGESTRTVLVHEIKNILGN